MLGADIKKIFIKKSIRYIIIVLVVFACLIVTYKSRERYLQTENKITASVNKVRLEIASNNKMLSESEISIKTWTKFNETNGGKTGLKIDEGRKVIGGLKTKYHLQDMSIRISNPSEIGAAYTKPKATAIYSELELVFTAYDDIDVFNFVGSIIKELPGYTEVTNLEIRKEEWASSLASIDKVLEEKKLTPPLKCQFKLLWKDIKENSV